MPLEPTTCVPRIPGRAAAVAALAWISIAVALSASALAWHLGYARAGHPALFPFFAGALAVAAFVLPPVYQLVRRNRLWKYEPLLLAVPALGAPLLYAPLATLVVAWIALAMYGTGRLARRGLGLQVGSLPGELVLSFAIGCGVIVWPLALLGLTQLYRPWAFLLLLAALTGAGALQVPALFRTLRQFYREWASTKEISELPGATLFVVMGALLASGLAVALTPSTAFDPLRFHLPLARYYSATGGLNPLPSDGYGYNPQNFEMMLAMGYNLAGQIGAQLITPVFFLLFLAALFAVSRAAGLGRAAAVTATMFAAAIPYVHWTGVNVKHDIAVAFLHLAALLAYLRWRETGNFRWIHLGVFLAATSFGFKHPAAFGILGLSALFIHAAWRQPNRLRSFASCAAIFLILGAFWQVRSYVLTGDAFFYYNLAQPLPGDHAEQIGSPAKRLLTGITWPIRIHFDSGLFFRSATGNAMGFFLLLFAPLWLLLKRRRPSPEARACLIFAGISLAAWSFYVPLLRFVIAPLSLIAVFTAARLYEWQRASAGLHRLGLRLGAGYAILCSLCIILILEVNGPQFRYFAGQFDHKEYLREALLTYRSLEALAEYATPEDGVLGVHNCSMAYAPYPQSFACGHHELDDPEQIAEIHQAAGNPRVRFLILPAQPIWSQILRDATQDRPAETLYVGEHYSLHRLQ